MASTEKRLLEALALTCKGIGFDRQGHWLRAARALASSGKGVGFGCRDSDYQFVMAMRGFLMKNSVGRGLAMRCVVRGLAMRCGVRGWAIRCWVAVVAAVVPSLAMAWGQKGHDVVANIASRHLTPAAAAAVDSIFEGRSMVYWANWLDNASHTPAYDYSRTWHYKNINADESYASAPLNPKGDVATAVNELAAKLLSGTASGPEGKLALKMVVHLVGDLHQPLHLGRLSDLGGNRHKVLFFETETNLHSVWDSRLPETGRKWSYTEWTEQLDRADESAQREICQGCVSDWCRETYEIAKDVYGATPEGTVVGYDYIAGWTPTVEQQFLRGGLRLAHLLNYIFDADYRAANESPLDR